MKKAARTILLNPGPVNVSMRVKRALLKADICHREKEFSDLLASVGGSLQEIFSPGREHQPVIISGSGTAALEAAIISTVGEHEKILILDNGVYGDRMARIAAANNIEVEHIKSPWGHTPGLESARQSLEVDLSIGLVAAVHHETTLGFINPMPEICKLAHEFGKPVIIDSISGLGGEEIDLGMVDMVVGSANKCIQGVPGVSFVMMKKDMINRIEKAPKRSFYLDLSNLLAHQQRLETPFTPAVKAFYALDEALAELREETLPKRIERYRAAARMLRDGFSGLGLKTIVEEIFMSNTITALEVPPEIGYEKLHDELKARNFVIYSGQGNLEGKMFRVANMGDIQTEEFELFLEVLEEILNNG